jgi:uncharacterized phage-like protein YoqJ
MKNNVLTLNRACAFTGHRPQKFSFGFDESAEQCVAIKKVLREQIEVLVTEGVTVFYSGMALGVDQWAASIVLDIREANPSVRLIAVRPHEGQANDWTEKQRELYFDTLAVCDNEIILQTHYTPSCMFERNRYLVDRADVLLAVYDGGERGGSAYTVKYAKEKQRRVIVIDPDTLAVTK